MFKEPQVTNCIAMFSHLCPLPLLDLVNAHSCLLLLPELIRVELFKHTITVCCETIATTEICISMCERGLVCVCVVV